MTRSLMIRDGTPVEDRRKEFGLLVKREDLSCPPPGPPFSKARGVFSRVASRPERVFGVLDTRHSQGGWAVARACQLLDRQCFVFYPAFKHEDDVAHPRAYQLRAAELGAVLFPIAAGRSAILYHAAKKTLVRKGGTDTYMMPNALKLDESVLETANELAITPEIKTVRNVLVSASSATLASGVLLGLWRMGWKGTLHVHMGYERSRDQVLRYMHQCIGGDAAMKFGNLNISIIDEGYAYKDTARPGPEPSWPCNSHYDLKAFRWWMAKGRDIYEEALLWNIG